MHKNDGTGVNIDGTGVNIVRIGSWAKSEVASGF